LRKILIYGSRLINHYSNKMYPRTIQIESPKLKTFLQKKGELVEVGRAKSVEIEQLEKEMDETDKRIQEEEKKVDISDINEKQKAVGAKVDEAIIQMEGLKKEIYDRMIKQVPGELHAKYDELRKKKEELETERNKIALKAQKWNDKIIPLGRQMMKPFLTDMYEDFETLSLTPEGVIEATIFSHLVDWKNNFKKK
jgi:hypothetical protein